MLINVTSRFSCCIYRAKIRPSFHSSGRCPAAAEIGQNAFKCARQAPQSRTIRISHLCQEDYENYVIQVGLSFWEQSLAAKQLMAESDLFEFHFQPSQPLHSSFARVWWAGKCLRRHAHRKWKRRRPPTRPCIDVGPKPSCCSVAE